MPTAEDQRHMAHALRLARRGLCTTTPNPRVGCVVVREGEVVGSGWHERAGGPHAEIVALREAGNRARGATVYLTLEPCSHHGRTPPCAGALLEAGIGRLVAAMEDPNPRVAGSGFAGLRAAGVAVETGVMEAEARELNVGFFSRMTRGRPWVRLKVAASLDGRTALANGHSQWITGEDARRDAHRLRARSCAVLTGGGTVLEDDPQLTVRHVDVARQPLRVVADSRLETPPGARVLAGGGALIATACDDAQAAARLRAAGAEVLLLPDPAGRVDLAGLLAELARREVNELLVEGGWRLNGALLRAGLADELVMYFAPVLLGDKARAMFELPELEGLEEKVRLTIVETRMVGSDLRITARFP